MASVAIGQKRPFATLGDDGGNIYHSNQHSTEQEVNVAGTLGNHQRYRPNANVSATSSTRSTPTPTSLSANRRRLFMANASVVLLGMPGTGKSTLAVIASMACRRRIVDIDDLFQDTTGFSTVKYRKQFGPANYNLRQEELLRTVLREHDKGTIIVCNGASLERNGQALLQDFAGAHPVVHVLRDLRSLHEYLGAPDLQKLKDMLALTAPVLRRCCNYEFYNISEANVARSDASAELPAAPTFLTLKRAQRTFLKFLSLITSNDNPDGLSEALIPPLEPGYPLSDVATELRKYTCAVQVPLEDLLAEEINVQNLEVGSDAFEIVFDPRTQRPGADVAEEISSCMSKVRRSTVVPIIYHVVPTYAVGRDRTLYTDHVRHGLRLAPEYATVDLSMDEATLAEVVASRGKTKIIGILHTDKPWDNAYWVAQYENAVHLGCSAIRFTRPAGCTDDDVAARNFSAKMSTSDAHVPLICYNTGRAGRRSAVFNQHLTPVVAASTREESTFTGSREYPRDSWVTAREVTQALYASFTFDAMQMYIIGASLGYSVSPAMHNAAYESCGMPHEFIRIQSPSLNSLKEYVRKPSFGGSIVIQPFKMEVIALADSLSQHARAIGAVNTLIPVRHVKGDGSVPSDLELLQERNQSGPVQALYGDNTEWIGIRSCVRRGLSPANAVRHGSCGLVIGAGGMARAAVYALLQLGVKNIAIFNRTHERTEKLVAHFARLTPASTGSGTVSPATRPNPLPVFTILKSRNEPWPQHLRQPTIILSCIPADPIDDSPAAQFTLPRQWMESSTGGVVMEIAYKTLKTPLMQQVRDASSKLWTYMDGLDFLPEQAFAQFELFTGKRAPRRVMREEVLRAWRDEQGNADMDMVRRRLAAIDDQEP